MIQCPNCGRENADNFNFCLEEAKGAYILLLHDDDLIDPDFVSICMERAQGSVEHSFIRTGTRIIDPFGNVLRERTNVVDERTPEGLYRAWFNGNAVWYYCSTLFNTKALRDVGGFDSIRNYLDDGYAIVRLAERTDWLDVPEVKASFRRSPEQMTYAIRTSNLPATTCRRPTLSLQTAPDAADL